MNNYIDNPQFIRVSEKERPEVQIFIDNRPVKVLAGDTVLSALLVNGNIVRNFEFDDSSRGGFCLMGACQDCWVKLEDGSKLRACTTFVREGMSLLVKSETP